MRDEGAGRDMKLSRESALPLAGIRVIEFTTGIVGPTLGRLLAEFGVALSDDVTVRVWDSTSEVRYLVLPMRPQDTENLDEQALAKLVTRDCMIGTGLALTPDQAEASAEGGR